MRRYLYHYARTVGSCCPEVSAAKATGLDVPAANAGRTLAATFLAAGVRELALVQWLRLPLAERHAGDGLDQAPVEALRSSRNETTLLAVRLGHERLCPMDDHSSDRYGRDIKAYVAAM